jgi:hypothetical protein
MKRRREGKTVGTCHFLVLGPSSAFWGEGGGDLIWDSLFLTGDDGTRFRLAERRTSIWACEGLLIIAQWRFISGWVWVWVGLWLWMVEQERPGPLAGLAGLKRPGSQ